MKQRVEMSEFMKTPEAIEIKTNLDTEVTNRLAEIKKDLSKPGDEHIFRGIKQQILSTAEGENSRKLFEYWMENGDIVDVSKTQYKWASANWYGAGFMMVYDDALSFLEKVKGLFGFAESVENDRADGKIIDGTYQFEKKNKLNPTKSSKKEIKQFLKKSDLESFNNEMQSYKQKILVEQKTVFDQEKTFISSFLDMSQQSIQFKKYSERLLTILIKDIDESIQNDNLFLITSESLHTNRLENYVAAYKLQKMFAELFELKKKFITTYDIFLTTIEPQLEYALNVNKFEEQISYR